MPSNPNGGGGGQSSSKLGDGGTRKYHHQPRSLSFFFAFFFKKSDCTSNSRPAAATTKTLFEPTRDDDKSADLERLPAASILRLSSRRRRRNNNHSLKPRKRKKKEITLKGDEEIDRSFFSLHLTWWRHVQRLRKHTVAPPFLLFGCSYINHEVVWWRSGRPSHLPHKLLLLPPLVGYRWRIWGTPRPLATIYNHCQMGWMERERER